MCTMNHPRMLQIANADVLRYNIATFTSSKSEGELVQ